MMSFTQRHVQCLSPSGLHRMAYTEWGDPDQPRVLICVHGLTRNGRDFDRLAAALRDRFRVICPDVVGRGRSDWLRDPQGYALPQYLSDLVTLIARLGVEQVDWLGTSMGGLIGMLLASQPGTPVARLVLNDVGPHIPVAALRRLNDYVGRMPDWPDSDAAERFFRTIHAPFGPLSDADWRHLTRGSIVQRDDGRWVARFDPAIAVPFQSQALEDDIILWPIYERVACPTLAVRGADSDLLTRDTWQRMGERGPRARQIEFAGIGHAPAFLEAAQIAAVRDFLLDT